MTNGDRGPEAARAGVVGQDFEQEHSVHLALRKNASSSGSFRVRVMMLIE